MVPIIRIKPTKNSIALVKKAKEIILTLFHPGKRKGKDEKNYAFKFDLITCIFESKKGVTVGLSNVKAYRQTEEGGSVRWITNCDEELRYKNLLSNPQNLWRNSSSRLNSREKRYARHYLQKRLREISRTLSIGQHRVDEFAEVLKKNNNIIH